MVTPKMVSAYVILALRGADAKVSVPDLENVSTTNVIVAKKKVLLIWENTVNCQDAQASAPVPITAFVAWTLKNVFALKVGLGTIAARPIAQGNPFVLAMEAAVIRTHDGATVSRIGPVLCVNFLVSMERIMVTHQVAFAILVFLVRAVMLNAR